MVISSFPDVFFGSLSGCAGERDLFPLRLQLLEGTYSDVLVELCHFLCGKMRFFFLPVASLTRGALCASREVVDSALCFCLYRVLHLVRPLPSASAPDSHIISPPLSHQLSSSVMIPSTFPTQHFCSSRMHCILSWRTIFLTFSLLFMRFEMIVMPKALCTSLVNQPINYQMRKEWFQGIYFRFSSEQNFHNF